MKKVPKTDGEENDSCLVAGTSHVQHGLSQRERARKTQWLHGTNECDTGEMEHERERNESAGEQESHLHRSGLPRGDTDEGRTDGGRHGPLQPIKMWQRRDVLPQQ